MIYIHSESGTVQLFFYQAEFSHTVAKKRNELVYNGYSTPQTYMILAVFIRLDVLRPLLGKAHVKHNFLSFAKFVCLSVDHHLLSGLSQLNV